MEIGKLAELGKNLIKAKKDFFNAEYKYKKAYYQNDISIRKNLTVHKTETAIKSLVDAACEKDCNTLKLAKIALSEAEILYELEKEYLR